MPFSQKGVKGCIFSVLGGFDHFWKPKIAFPPKKRKSAKSAKDEKASFSLRARNSEKRKVLGTFLEPKTPKTAFFTFGPTFAFWTVFGGKSALEAENVLIFTFWLPKVGKSLFCDFGRKRVPKTLWIQRVLRFWRKGVKMMFFIFQHKFMFLCRASNNIFLFSSSPNSNFFLQNFIFFAPSAKQWKT